MGKGIIVTIASVVGVIAIIGIAWAFQYATADTRGAVAQQELVRADGAFRLAAYNHFFDLCTAIQGDEARIKALEEQAAFADTTVEKNRIRLTVPAIKSSRNAKIAQYNNDAAKAGSVGIFRSNKLPYNINANDKETLCAF